MLNQLLMTLVLCWFIYKLICDYNFKMTKKNKRKKKNQYIYAFSVNDDDKDKSNNEELETFCNNGILKCSCYNCDNNNAGKEEDDVKINKEGSSKNQYKNKNEYEKTIKVPILRSVEVQVNKAKNITKKNPRKNYIKTNENYISPLASSTKTYLVDFPSLPRYEIPNHGIANNLPSENRINNINYISQSIKRKEPSINLPQKSFRNIVIPDYNSNGNRRNSLNCTNSSSPSFNGNFSQNGGRKGFPPRMPIKVLPNKIKCVPSFKKLKTFDVPDEIKNIFINSNSEIKENPSDYERYLNKYRTNKIQLKKENYFEYFTNLIYIEEAYVENDLNNSTMKNIELSPVLNNKNNKFVKYMIDVKEINGKSLSIKDGTLFYIKHTDYVQWIFDGKIDSIYDTKIHLKFNDDYEDMDSFILNNNKYDIYFILNRLTIKLEHTALQYIKVNNLINYLYPIKQLPPIKEKNYNDFVWYNTSIADNKEQQEAIKNIINSTSYPHPYIIFGPPGTGKTVTIIEATLQIYVRSTSTNVLITGMSNSSCDNIAKRLLKYTNIIDSTKILRLYAETASQNIDPELKLISNYSEVYQYKFPELFELYQYRIVIVTMATSGRLAQLNIDQKHFSHVFIDEAGSGSETNCLISIAGVVTSNCCVNANIILAGDPNQLGPVIFSQHCKKLGYEISLLERLMKFEIYQKKTNTNRYNTKLIIKLLRNYRSHPSIMFIPNKLFYDGEIKTVGDPSIINSKLNSKILINPKFPIIFHSVKGRFMQDIITLSIYNNGEINVVMDYVEEILYYHGVVGHVRQEDIGIISPYKTQVIKLMAACKIRNLTKIEIGSVEQFQGREKQIIIVSTVRSLTDNIGFLRNPKRFNVAITRAKSLLICIGDADTLQKNNECWNPFIQYCIENKAFKQQSNRRKRY